MSLLPTRHLPRLLASLLLGASLAATAATPSAGTGATTPQALAAAIDAQIDQPRFAAASWGVAVMSLDDGRVLYAHRADRLLQPASTAKLFTAALSLGTLGADYRIPTRLLAAGAPRHGRLDGPLILYGMGDPTLGTPGSEDWADQLAGQLAARQIRLIRGNLIADDSYFTGASFGDGWEAGDLQSWFAVPSSALSVGENIADLRVTPGSAAGMPARITVDPVEGMPDIAGQLATTLPHGRSDINLYRAPGAGTLYAFGHIPAGVPPQNFKLAVPDPALLAARELRQALARRRIHLTGKVQVLHWPQDDGALLAHAVPLAQVWSPPLFDILQRGLKRSQNLYLQNLLLSGGAREQATAPATGFLDTEAYGMRAMQALLAQAGIAPSDCLLQEGTGLSRRDLVTPNAMLRLLAFMAAQPYGPRLREALPIAGVDGTLIHRMRGSAAENNVHAKTGSMAYVDSLAGYVTSASGQRLAFAIMLNNYQPPADGPGADRTIDAIANALAAYRGAR